VRRTPRAAVTDQHAAVLRAFLSARTADDADRVRQLVERLAQTGPAEGLSALIYAAFLLSARHRFSPAWTLTEIV
jgi:hypothetical protein